MQPLPPDQREEAYAQFRRYLRQRGLRQTPERFEVLEALYNTQGHTDADALYFRLNEKKRSISRATVYNTLNLLMDCELVCATSLASTVHSTSRRTAIGSMAI